MIFKSAKTRKQSGSLETGCFQASKATSSKILSKMDQLNCPLLIYSNGRRREYEVKPRLLTKTGFVYFRFCTHPRIISRISLLAVLAVCSE